VCLSPQDALSATQEDEANFKEKVEEFQRTVQRLSITKVDRSEIATMQEFIVTAEATLKKLTKDKENSKEVRMHARGGFTLVSVPF
jgi:chaperonin cofactor prefoldin